MTDKPQDLGAYLKAQGERLRKALAENNEKSAQLKESLAEHEQLLADNAALERDFILATGQPWPNRKSGRPGVWKAGLGYELYTGVRDIRAANGNCSIREAIRILKTRDRKWAEFPVHRDGHEELERNYQEAKKFWEPWIERDEELEARFQQLIAKSDVAKTRTE